MPEEPLTIRLALDLQDPSHDSELDKHGPLFHRWLPDGHRDAIALQTGTPRYQLDVWFERCGFIRDQEVVFDYQRREVDPHLMSQQGVLDAGALRGLLRVAEPPQPALKAIVDNVKGNPDYLEFSKRLIEDVLYPRLTSFLDILRIRFGQYWIPDPLIAQLRKEAQRR